MKFQLGIRCYGRILTTAAFSKDPARGVLRRVSGFGLVALLASRSFSTPYEAVLIIGLQATDMAHDRIEINPEIMGGKPVIRGTRVPVELILRKLGAGMTVEAVLADHPRLTVDDIRAAQAFAADYIADEELVYR
jgi:uncharacterized protein (DUF433 family)